MHPELIDLIRDSVECYFHEHPMNSNHGGS
jgi:hypothetical protein